MLLLKQDKLAALEAALDKLDEEERCALFLGCNRKDQNQGRLQILEEIDRAMLNYGKSPFSASMPRWLKFPRPIFGKLSSILEAGWRKGKGCKEFGELAVWEWMYCKRRVQLPHKAFGSGDFG